MYLYTLEKVIPSIRSLILRMRESSHVDSGNSSSFQSCDVDSRASYPRNASQFATLVGYAEERTVTTDSQRPLALIGSIRIQKYHPCLTPFIPEALG